jgi:fructokinase
MTQHEPPLVVGLGEMLWDCFGEARHPGGAPANVAFHAQQLGLRGAVLTRVGQDELGDDLLRFLTEQGLATTWVQRDPLHLTGIATVDSSRETSPQFVFRPDSAWDFLEFNPAVEQLLQDAAAVCFGTLAQRSPDTRGMIHHCLQHVRPACQIVYDVNLRRPWFQREWIEASLVFARAVKLNQDEVAILGDLLGFTATDLPGFARELQDRFKIETVCITRGADGCFLRRHDQTADVPGKPILVADTVGAGDAFTAGLIWATLQDWPLPKVAEFANAVGALVASRPGAMPPLRAEFAALQSEFGKSV